VVLFTALLFVWGLVFGSFFTVLATRLPRRTSILAPPSSCPHCGRRIAARDLIPIVSFLLLRGRCRHCRAPISGLYPALEAATAILFALAGLADGPTAALGPTLVLLSVLVVATATDLGHRIIPNRLILGGLAVGALALLPEPPARWLGAFEGGALLFAITYALAVLSRGGFGGGDVKLAGLMGFLLGPGLGILALLVAFLVGGLAGLFLLSTGRKGRKDAIPFGPYLALGGTFAALVGDHVLHWYTVYAHLGR
jgi:prepilin signal peptidase PulO-like enzyme (type II secretory pathway)